MGFETNDDAATGLPLVMTGPDSTRRLAVIHDEQNNALLLLECEHMVRCARKVAEKLADGKPWGPNSLAAAATWLNLRADGLESAIARANGGAE